MRKLISNLIVGGFKALGLRGIIAVGVLVLLLGGYVRWQSDKRALVRKQEEIVMLNSMIADLQGLIGATTKERKAMRMALDSAKMMGSEYATQSAFWRDRVAGIQGVVADQQRYVRDLERSNDSLRRARVVYVDRCWNALGREVKCRKR